MKKEKTEKISWFAAMANRLRFYLSSLAFFTPVSAPPLIENPKFPAKRR